MITLRPAEDRGHANFGWLDSHHSFSFGSYYDPRHMGFRSLRVVNEDRVIGGAGFDTHGHRDMEIISYVLDGALAHKDNQGNGETLTPGEVQVMSAGTGILHSEFNANKDQGVHFLQMWVMPDRQGEAPDYQQKAFPAEQRLNRLTLVASPDGVDGSLRIKQDARLYLAALEAGAEITHRVAEGRGVWLQVARGTISIGDLTVSAGDGVAIEDETLVSVTADEDAEILLYDLK